jgi:hypothetical protein
MSRTLNFEAEPLMTESWEFELTSDEKAKASADASRRAAKQSFDRFRRDCKGVRLLRRLTKEPSDPTTKSLRLKKRLEAVPELFRQIRLAEQTLRHELAHARSVKERDALRQQHRSTVAKMLEAAGFDSRVPWTEQSALSHARCELSEFDWIQFSLCDGKEVETPDRFARAAAEHYLKTETGLTANGQTAKCEVNSVFCDVRFPNGVVVRVNFSNIPDFFTVTQIAPRAGPKREYRYSCFRGQINFSPNQDVPSAGDWPYGSKFSPVAPSIPSGPYKVSGPKCEDLLSDLTQLESANGSFTRSVELLDKLAKQKPRDESLWKETAETAKRQQATLKIILEKMIGRTRSGAYLKDGCRHKDLARVTQKIRGLRGVWLRKPPIQPIKKLRDQLVFRLRHVKGTEETNPLAFEAEPFELETEGGCGCARCRHYAAAEEEFEWEEESWASQYAPDVQQAIAMGGAVWPLALQRAIKSGIRDSSKLANIAFFMHHPERDGRPISPNESGAGDLIALWKFFRDEAKRMLSPAAPASTPSGSCRTTIPEVDTLMPESAPGVEAKKLASHRYGLPETIAALTEIGRRWQMAHPSGPLVRIRDISRCGGGSFPPHDSHRMGIDVDIGLMRSDGRTAPVNFRTQPSKYSQELTQEMVDTIRANGLLGVHRIWFSDKGVKNVTHDTSHNDHVHVRFCLPAHYDLAAMKRAAFPGGTRGTFAACTS